MGVDSMKARRYRRVRGLVAALVAGALQMTLAASAQEPTLLPSFAELEAAGATIGEIRVVTQDIFDSTDPR